MDTKTTEERVAELAGRCHAMNIPATIDEINSILHQSRTELMRKVVGAVDCGHTEEAARTFKYISCDCELVLRKVRSALIKLAEEEKIELGTNKSSELPCGHPDKPMCEGGYCACHN